MLRTAARRARKALSVPQYYGGGLFKSFSTDPVFLWAQAIAFKTFVTLLPLLLLAAGIFGLVLRGDNSMETVTGFLRSFLPPSQADGLIELVFALQEASGTLAPLGVAAFLATVVTLFATLRYVVGAAMGESRHRMRSILGGYAFDLRMMAQVGSLFLLSFVITAGTRVLTARSGALASDVGLDAATVTALANGLLHAVTLVVPYVLTVGMLAQLYYFVPRPRPPVRAALWGAAAAAVLFELAKNGFALYATHVADFDQYSDQAEGLGGLGGVFGLILAFVFWVYLSGLILIVGAVVASLYEKRHRPRKSRLRSMWSRMGSVRRHRSRFAANMAENAARAKATPLPADPPPVSPQSPNGLPGVSAGAPPAAASAAGGDGAQADAATPSP